MGVYDWSAVAACRAQRTARTILRATSLPPFLKMSAAGSPVSINCARELCARTMLSRISRNPCGARRDHTQYALIPLLRTLWPAYACLPIYLAACLPAYSTYASLLRYTVYTPTDTRRYRVSEVSARHCDTATALTSRSPSPASSSRRRGKTRRVRQTERVSKSSELPKESRRFLLSRVSPKERDEWGGRGRDNELSATTTRGTRYTRGMPRESVACYYCESDFTRQWLKIRLL